MLSKIFLGMSLIGAEWVLYLLIALSVTSVAIIIERIRFYRTSRQGAEAFRQSLRRAVTAGQWDEALKIVESRSGSDLETGLSRSLLEHRRSHPNAGPDILTEVAQDSVVRGRLQWEKNLAVLATIGSNAPFIGLFGTVLGIIKAFHDLSQQSGAGAQAVSSGISEALVATAVGLLVAIPAVVAFNLFQRKVKTATAEAESLKSFLVGNIAKAK